MELKEELELLKALAYKIINLIDYYQLFQNTPSCNDCARKNNCIVKPDIGERVRHNCFMYISEDEITNKKEQEHE